MRKKTAFIIILVGFFVMVGYGTYFVYNNTSLLRPNPSTEQIAENNFNTIDMNTNTEWTSDVTTLVANTLIVPDQYRIGALAIGRTLYLPIGFDIQVFAAGLQAPRFFTFDDADTLIVADKGAGTIVMLPDVDADGIADEQIVIDRGLRVMHSVYYYNGDLYSAEEDSVSVYRDIQPDGSFIAKEELVSGLPSDGGHSTRTVIVGPDEKLYVSIGSSCNVCEESDERRASVVRYNLDGSGEEIFASGLRNSVGILFHGDTLWSVNNGRDRIGDDIPPEEVNILTAGHDYGWPYCYGNGMVNPEYAGAYEAYCTAETTYPTYTMQAHSAPLGLTFVPADTSFPSALTGQMLIGFHGSWNRTIPTGYKVVRLDISNPDAEMVNFVTGWLDAAGDVWGRPVDVGFGGDGALYISDDQAGAIYRVTYQVPE